MRLVRELTRKGYLSARQARIAHALAMAAGEELPLPRALGEQLADAVRRDLGLTLLEERHGLPPRSGKALVRFAPDVAADLAEGRLREWDADPDAPNSERPEDLLAWVTAEDLPPWVEWVTAYGMTPMQAQLVEALRRAPRMTLSDDGIFNRLYGQLPDSEQPGDEKQAVTMHGWKATKKLERSSWCLERVRGFGYRLRSRAGIEEAGACSRGP